MAPHPINSSSDWHLDRDYAEPASAGWRLMLKANRRATALIRRSRTGGTGGIMRRGREAGQRVYRCCFSICRPFSVHLVRESVRGFNPVSLIGGESPMTSFPLLLPDGRRYRTEHVQKWPCSSISFDLNSGRCWACRCWCWRDAQLRLSLALVCQIQLSCSPLAGMDYRL